jgi:hypothetical protein
MVSPIYIYNIFSLVSQTPALLLWTRWFPSHWLTAEANRVLLRAVLLLLHSWLVVTRTKYQGKRLGNCRAQLWRKTLEQNLSYSVVRLRSAHLHRWPHTTLFLPLFTWLTKPVSPHKNAAYMCLLHFKQSLNSSGSVIYRVHQYNSNKTLRHYF